MTTAAVPYVLGQPGMRASVTAEMRRVLTSTSPLFLPGGRTIDGVKSRDPGNTPYIEALRAGLIMGKISATGYYANSFFGSIANAEAQGSTQIELTVAAATELVRRIGATGNLNLTGPPVASGVVRTVQFAYTAVNTSNGNVTITAQGANQVDQINLAPASTGGNIQFVIQKPDGTFVTTANAAWNATDATYLSAINTQLDASSGVAGGIVASAIPATDTDLGFRFTYSGGAYAGQSWTAAQVALFPTSTTIASYQRVTSAFDARFIAGALVGPTDGSQTPVTFLPDGSPMPVTDQLNTGGVAAIQFPQFPVAAIVNTSFLVDYPSDPSLKAWLKGLLSTNSGAKLIFDDAF